MRDRANITLVIIALVLMALLSIGVVVSSLNVSAKLIKCENRQGVLFRDAEGRTRCIDNKVVK